MNDISDLIEKLTAPDDKTVRERVARMIVTAMVGGPDAPTVRECEEALDYIENNGGMPTP